MKILFLDTGAADFPKKRTRCSRPASALINNDLLIDPGPCVLDAIKEW